MERVRRRSILLVWLLAWPAIAHADLAAGTAALARQDYATAHREFSLLAEQGDATAQYNLAVLYYRGLGLERDFAAAAGWFRKSADQGEAGAAYALGLMYANGEGVERDPVEAYTWFKIASLGGNDEARKSLYRVTRMMTPDQKAEALKRADERTSGD